MFEIAVLFLTNDFNDLRIIDENISKWFSLNTIKKKLRSGVWIDLNFGELHSKIAIRIKYSYVEAKKCLCRATQLIGWPLFDQAKLYECLQSINRDLNMCNR